MHNKEEFVIEAPRPSMLAHDDFVVEDINPTTLNVKVNRGYAKEFHSISLEIEDNFDIAYIVLNQAKARQLIDGLTTMLEDI